MPAAFLGGKGVLTLPGALPRPLAFRPTTLTPVEDGAVCVWGGSCSLPLEFPPCVYTGICTTSRSLESWLFSYGYKIMQSISEEILVLPCLQLNN